jgi:outer membrane protein OmpA-like peptidoglycan-associated protein
LNAPEAFKFDKAAALQSLGVAVGQKYDPAQLVSVATKLKAIPNVKDATVAVEETEGGYDLIANLIADAPAPAPVAVPAPAELVAALGDINVYFATNSTEVNEADFKKLVRAAGAIVKAGNKNPVAVTGFADPRGNVEYNQALSLRRANAVCDILVSNGVERSLLTPDGAGVPGTESLEEQRRVEVRPSK